MVLFFILVAGQIEQAVQNVKIKMQNDNEKSKNNPTPKFLILIFAFSILLIWYLAEFISVYPSYLTYFNEFALLRPSWASDGQAGGPAGGHNYVVDSNLDWGQDLWRLGDFVKANNIQKYTLIISVGLNKLSTSAIRFSGCTPAILRAPNNS